MVWPLVAMAAVSAVGAVVSSNSTNAQNKSQLVWNQYNSQMGYNNDMANIQSQVALGMFNAALTRKAAEANAGATLDMARFNAQQIRETTAYNNLLIDEEERLLWEQEGLDQVLLGKQRARERGEIVASQASSGLTIGDGSHKDVVIAQRAEELMDAFVIRHNADIGAAKIANAKAQGSWQGEMQVRKIMYEGYMGSKMTLENARLASMGTMMETALSADAGARTAQYSLDSGMSGAYQQFSANDAVRASNLTQGLFSSASSAISSYYGNKNIAVGPKGSDSLLTRTPSSTYNDFGLMGGR